MPKNKVRLEFSGFEEMAEKLDKLGGDLKKTSEEALLKGKAVVTKNLLRVSNKSNYPAHGKYSTGDTRHSINTDKTVNWQGTLGAINIGYDFYGSKGSGMKSIFLMYGTPRHKPPMKEVPGMYDAVYGKKTKSEVKKVQKEVFAKAIKERMEG